MEDKIIKIRGAVLEDAPRLIEIYNPYILKTTVTYEYEPVTAAEFSERMRAITEKFPYLVAVIDGKIIGYAYASPYHTRKAYSWDCELSVYVDMEYCGGGVGTALYGKLIDILSKMNYVNAYALLDYPNEGSMALHKKFGFTQVGIFNRTAYKFGKWLNMIVLEKRINDPLCPRDILTNFKDLI